MPPLSFHRKQGNIHTKKKIVWRKHQVIIVSAKKQAKGMLKIFMPLKIRISCQYYNTLQKIVLPT